MTTVAQFRQLPGRGDLVYELDRGEVVVSPRAKARHYKQQVQFQDRLTPKLSNIGRVLMEFPYRPVPEFELRAADVALVSHDRWKAIDPEDNLLGAPELVIEVKSPSNTRKHLQELVALCLANGSIECWIADPVNMTITVARRDGSVSVYRVGDSVPLTSFGSDELPVSEIFVY